MKFKNADEYFEWLRERISLASYPVTVTEDGIPLRDWANWTHRALEGIEHGWD